MRLSPHPAPIIALACALAALSSLAGGVALADPGHGFVDRPTALDVPGTLHVVREQLDPHTGLRAVTVRYVHDGSAAPARLTGMIVVEGATIAAALHQSEALAASDGRHAGARHTLYPITARGLESPGDGPEATGDALRAGPRTVSFAFAVGPHDASDELRLLLDPGANPGAAELVLAVLAADQRDGWAASEVVPPVHVGQVVGDAVPDDGVYDASLGAPIRLRLAHEDLDVRPLVVSAGTAAAGRTGTTVAFELESCTADDPDRDDPHDRNGPLAVPCTEPLRALRALATPLVAADGALLEPAALELELPPLALEPGSRAEATLTLRPPAGQAPGLYQGLVIVYEDNDDDGQLSERDTRDAFVVEVSVTASGGPYLPGADAASDTPAALDMIEGFDLGLGADGGADLAPDGGAWSEDPLYLRGGEACACAVVRARGGASGGALAGLLMAFCAGLLWRARGRTARRKNGTARVLVVALTLAPSGLAQAQGLDIDRLETPGVGADRMVGVDYGETLGHLEVAVSALAGYARAPLVAYRGDAPVETVVGHRVEAVVAASVGLFDTLELGLVLPFVAWQEGVSLSGEALAAQAVGDLRLGARVSLLPASWGAPLRLALMADVALPTGDPTALVSSGSPRVGVALAAGYAFGASGLVAAADLGARFVTGRATLLELEEASELTLAAGLSWSFLDAWTVAAELGAVSPLDALFADARTSGLEALGIARWQDPASGVFVLAAAGTSLVPGYGVPARRAVLGVGYSPVAQTEAVFAHALDDEAVRDTDRDGLVDADDACPLEPEDFDGFQDEDGCPDPDNDGDGIPDRRDGAPELAEDLDGFDDHDGIPDDDNDLDGVPDAVDACPLEPEDHDGFRDEDGCPDPDNDEDGTSDWDDLCPLEPGHPARGGCP